VEAVETTAAVAATEATEVVFKEAGSSSSRPVAVEVVEARVPEKPAAAVQEQAAPEATTRAASPEIQEAEETGASLSQGAVGGESQTLELACTSWMATSGLGDDFEDEEEVAAHNTLERGLNWARCAFDELIFPATSVSFLIWRSHL
jgi:hypothetical protein